MRRDTLIFMFLACMAILAAVLGHAWAGDNFVRLLEARQGVVPGQTRVLPECNCTIRYVGTFVHGKRYTVVIDKLD